jgi:diguanylate cyclase (GGDEF)-like protein/PAS domain S-box-containing protein
MFMSNLYEGVYVVDTRRKIIFWNQGSEAITGYKAEEVMNSYCFNNILQHVDKFGKQLCQDGCPLHDTLKTGNINEAEVFLHHKNGHRIPVSVKSIPLYDEHNNIVAAIEAFTDARYNQDTYEENTKLKQLIEIDALTSIYNRRYLEFQLASSSIENKQFNTPFGVLFLDIDLFKNVNDTYGHNVGDEVLKTIANTIKSSLRVNDIAGRWGGEEFVIILKRIDIEEMTVLAERLRMVCKNSSYKIDHDKTISVTVSIGGSLYQSNETIEDLVGRADRLMYESKQSGRDKTTIQ